MRLDVHEVSKRYAIPGRSLAADGGWAETGKTIAFVTQAIEEAVSVGTTLVMMSPMPPDLLVVPPPPSVPRENARFAGRWVGKWERQLDHVLVVELQVQNDQTTEVIAVYSWGVSAELGVGSPGWTRVRGRIENGALRLALTRVQATAVYTMQADGTLVGEYWRGDRVTSRARLARALREGQ